MSNQSNAITQRVVPGSLKDIMIKENKSFSEIFVNVKMVAVCDCSSSMEKNDSRGMRSRWTVMVEELRKIQGKFPGSVAVVSFSTEAVICENGNPLETYGSTNVAEAIQLLIRKGLGKTKAQITLISDGEPDSESQAIAAAKKLGKVIDTIYVGPEGGDGRDFLKRLSRACGGTHQDDFKVNLLSDKLTQLLLSSGKK